MSVGNTLIMASGACMVPDRDASAAVRRTRKTSPRSPIGAGQPLREKPPTPRYCVAAREP